jgi:two-component system response regulator ChvI
VFDNEAGAAKRHAEHAPGDGVAGRQSFDGDRSRVSAPGADPAKAAAPSGVFRKHRLLVVEDRLLIAERICDSLQEHGYLVVGPTGSLQAACGLARTADIDGAVLDLKLGQDLCLPIAAALKARGIPFVVLTGYPVRPEFPGFEPAAWIVKPMEPAALREAVELMLAGGAKSSAAVAPAARRETGMQPAADVVLVDDDDDYREVLSADLADRGLTISCFADGPSLLAAMSNGATAHVAVLDWTLPEMSGFELLGALRQRGFDLPVVFLTGYAPAERELQALGHGAVDFVDKTRGLDVLTRRLRLIIDAQRQPPAAANPPVERHGALTLQSSTARARWRERDVGLTITEYKLVLQLVMHKGWPQTYRALYDTAHYAGFIAGSGDDGHNANVRSLIKRIRKKFLALDPGFAEIVNVEAVGYHWRLPERGSP